jgi:hypothetical protein
MTKSEDRGDGEDNIRWNGGEPRASVIYIYIYILSRAFLAAAGTGVPLGPLLSSHLLLPPIPCSRNKLRNFLFSLKKGTRSFFKKEKKRRRQEVSSIEKEGKLEEDEIALIFHPCRKR